MAATGIQRANVCCCRDRLCLALVILPEVPNRVVLLEGTVLAVGAAVDERCEPRLDAPRGHKHRDRIALARCHSCKGQFLSELELSDRNTLVISIDRHKEAQVLLVV